MKDPLPTKIKAAYARLARGEAHELCVYANLHKLTGIFPCANRAERIEKIAELAETAEGADVEAFKKMALRITDEALRR